MSVLIVNMGEAGKIPKAELIALIAAGAEPPDLYLMSYDPDAHDGCGDIRWTPDQALAMRFDDVHAAYREWKQVPVTRPLREDGKPNRPLTAYNITFKDVPS